MAVLHADETSIRVNTRNHWIHSCSGGDIVVKRCHRKRGAEAVDAINIIPRYGVPGPADDDDDDDRTRSVLVHDRWATYFKYDNCDHSLCGAHLLRNLRHIEKAHQHNWATRMRQLLLATCREVADTETRTLSEVRFQEVSARYCAILKEGRKELPAPPPRQGKKGCLPRSEAEKLIDAFVEYKNEILRFAMCRQVPFTNSRSERDIQMAKVRQKISGTFRNVTHAHAYCRISSYLQSITCQGYNSLAAIQIALNGNAVDVLDHSK